MRPAVRSDAAAVAELAGELGYPSTPAEILARLDRLRHSPDSHGILVAERTPGDLVGWLHVFVAQRIETERFAEIGGLVVSAEVRGQGVGAVLLAHAERWALERGVATLRVRSNVVRERAHRFYESSGFAPVKNQVVLQKSLSRGPASPSDDGAPDPS